MQPYPLPEFGRQIQTRAFTMLELIVGICIAAALSVMAITFLANYVAISQKVANERTLTTLNSALQLYKSLGGMTRAHSLQGYNSQTKIDAVVSALKFGLTIGNERKPFFGQNDKLDTSQLYATGQGTQFCFAQMGSSSTMATSGNSSGDAKLETGSLFREYWLTISGYNVSNLTSDTDYPNSPDGSNYISSFSAGCPVYYGSGNAGQRIRGYLTPPKTGSYTFTLNCPRYCALLRLSTNSSSSGAVSITSNTCTSTTSAAKSLVAGQVYYIEVLSTASSYGSVSVGWQTTDGSFSEATISGKYLIPLTTANSPDITSLTITDQPRSTTFKQGTDATLSIAANSPNTISYQWKKDGSNIGGATRSTLTLSNIQSSDAGSYTCYVSDSSGANATSNSATVAVANSAGTGSVRQDYWTGLTGYAASKLVADARYPNSPTGTASLTNLQSSLPGGDYRGQLIQGYLVPSQTGDYLFTLSASRAETIAYLSSDATTEHASQLGSISFGSASTVFPKRLLAGRLYYIRILHTVDAAGGTMTLGWHTSDNSFSESVISGQYLMPYIP